MFDDWQVLLSSSFVHEPWLWLTGYRPLRNLSYVVDLFFGPLEPMTFHISNLCYHLANIVLLSILLKKIISPLSRFEWAAMAGVLIVFAIHPVQIESVVYISGRRDLVFVFCYLAGSILHFHFYEKRAVKRAWLFLVLFTFLATASKEAGITLPLFVIVMNRNNDLKSMWKIMAGKIFQPLWILTWTVTAAFSIVFMVYMAGMVLPSLQAGFMGGTLLTHLMNCALFVFRYIGIIFYPHTIAADYSYRSIHFIDSPLDTAGIAALASVMLLSFAALGICFYHGNIIHGKNNAGYRGLHIISTGWLWFVITLLPMSNIVPHVERFALHYLYLPVAGVCLIASGLFTVLLAWLPGTKGNIAEGIIVSGFLVFSLFLISGTRENIEWWKDELSFWQHNIAVHPQCARAQANLGMVLMKKNRKNEALAALERAVAIRDVPQAYLGLASMALDEKDSPFCLDKVKYYLGKVSGSLGIRIRKEITFIRGMIALKEEHYDLAASIGNDLATRWPEYDGGYYLKAKIALSRGILNDGVFYLEKAVRFNGFSQRNYVELIRGLTEMGKYREALAYLEKGFERGALNRDDPYRLNDKGHLLHLLENPSGAEALWRVALEKDARCLIAALNLSSLLYGQHRFDEVVMVGESFGMDMKDEQAFRSLPDIPETASKLMNNTALAHIHLNRIDEAEKILVRAVELWPGNGVAALNLKRLQYEKKSQ